MIAVLVDKITPIYYRLNILLNIVRIDIYYLKNSIKKASTRRIKAIDLGDTNIQLHDVMAMHWGVCEKLYSKSEGLLPEIINLIPDFLEISKKSNGKSFIANALKAYIYQDVTDLALRILVAKDLSKKLDKNILVIVDSYFIYKALKNEYTGVVLLFNPFGGMDKLFLKLLKKVTRKFSSSPKSTQESAENSGSVQSPKKDQTAKNCEVVFFPHQGIFYGDLYVKDHYYSDRQDSPFHPSKMLHVSLGESLNVLERSHSYYKANQIPFCDLNDLRKKNESAFIFLIKNIFNKSVIKYCLSGNTYIWAIVYRLVSDYCSFASLPAYFSNLKIALVGFESTFPPALALALSYKNIQIIGTQDRLLTAWMPRPPLLVDYYFAIGAESKEQMIKLDSAKQIKNIYVLGPARLDSFYRELNNPAPEKYLKIKSNKKLILALDYHSADTEDSNRLNYINHWKTNKVFYENIIKLCVENQNVHIVIKGKNYDFLKLDVFADIVKKIETTHNISVETNYKEHTPEKMVALADGVIALHTMLGDEALAVGKPVLFFDIIGAPSRFFNYYGYPVIARSYSELSVFVKLILNNQHNLSKEMQTTLKNKLFGGTNAENTKLRFIRQLESIYKENLS